MSNAAMTTETNLFDLLGIEPAIVDDATFAANVARVAADVARNNAAFAHSAAAYSAARNAENLAIASSRKSERSRYY